MPTRLTIISYTGMFFLTSAMASVIHQKPHQGVRNDPPPFKVSIRVQDEFACAGAIITSLWIFTVASCIHEFEKEYLTVKAGPSDAEPEGQLRRLSEILIHPKYHWESHDYDLAGVKLSKRLTFGTETQSIQMAVIPVQAGQNLMTTGRAHKNRDHNEEVKVIDRDDCQLIYDDKAEITPRMLCVWYENSSTHDVCDFSLNPGEPLVNARGHLIGLYSFNFGSEDFPAIFTNLQKIKWSFSDRFCAKRPYFMCKIIVSSDANPEFKGEKYKELNKKTLPLYT